MMMVTEMTDQKRRNHYDPFHLSPKRLKTGPLEGNGSFSHKEKKDKIGERVAALQQLVCPFGKSDTASVLTEATAYIKFLHDQLKVLSAPYLQSSPTDRLQNGEESYSLKTRGLCLIPVAATVQIARSNGADIWAPSTK
uniref:Transcription factor bHLH113-like isoform X1 n=1 Tax=Cymbidium sinense TaxID=112615 RepID=A0A513X4S3_9ASPA|nr:transcription factor bHLH113-like isoform X1 [Cymbidium sinense]